MEKVTKKFDSAACAVGQARGVVFTPCANLSVQLEQGERLLKEALEKIEASGMELRAWRLGEMSRQKKSSQK